jgi:hypothetical protein
MQHQYFKLWVGAPPESKDKKTIDLTKYVFGRTISLTDEDGAIKSLVFDLDNAYTLMDVLAIGMTVHFEGGSSVNSDTLITFGGDIKRIEPKFNKSGDVSLQITAYSVESKYLAVGVRDLIYPSKNHPKSWATGDLTYSDIIVNLAKDSNFKVLDENIDIKRDATASFKNPVRQKNETDWEFTQRLASKISATIWTETKSDERFIFLKQDSSLVSKVGDHTFFFPSKKIDNEFVEFTHVSPKQIQMVSVQIDLDRDSKKGNISVGTNPETGQTEVTNETVDDDGNLTQWVLDEEKLRGLSKEERQNLIDLFMSGRITWEGENGTTAAKAYFKKRITSTSSREPVPTNTEIVTLDENAEVTADGVSMKGEKKLTGNETYSTKLHTEKMKALSSEERTSIMGRIFRGEATEKDKQYYTIVASSTKSDKTDSGTQNQDLGNRGGAGSTDAKKKKRDAGFKITALIYGNEKIKPKLSYILEGLGKYSDKYYLYKIEYLWGNRGFLMRLIFVK